MRQSTHARLFACLAATAFVIAAGCVDTGSGGYADLAYEGPPAQTGEYTTDHYTVRVIGGKLGPRGQEMSRHGALLMEKMFEVYSGLDELPLPPGDDPMPFSLHLNREEYDRQAAIYDFPANSTNGFCTTGGEVHVFYRKSGKLPPESTAMHEGFHQYCNRALHYPTPQEVFERVPGYKTERIPTVPLWLAEGMAMNMESGSIQTDHNGIAIGIDDVGSVNAPRLAHLAELIKTNRAPSVRRTLNLIMGDQINIDDYSVMWGIVFDFRMATGNAIFVREQAELERAGPRAVREAMDAAIDPSRPYPYMRWPVPVTGRFMRACKAAWGLDVPALVETCLTGARESRDFDRQWNRRLTQAALAEVERLLRDNGETLEQWEEGWKKRMLALNAEVRGGRYVYVEPMGMGVESAGAGFVESSSEWVPEEYPFEGEIVPEPQMRTFPGEW
ncbi:MAG: hypothetical protein LBS30_05815 [Planctomycetota bacterium]|jgi:hypothetical protein|nr:hypothetical protein [Planctomycetota bacterium]